MDPVVETAAAASAQPAAVPPVTEPAADTRHPIERMSEDERHDWEKTGKLPESVTGKPVTAPAGDDAPAVDAKGQQVTDAAGKPVSRRQQEANRRIQEAIERGTAEARTRAEAAERRAAELEAKYKPAEPAKPAEQPKEDREPVLDDFLDQPDPYLALTNALVDYRIEQREKANEAKRSQQTAAQRAETAAETQFKNYQERETAFKATVPDFDARTLAVRQQIDPRLPLGQALLSSDVAPHLILHFADHQDDFDRIGALGQTNLPAALRELGKLEAKYDTGSTPAPAAAAPPVKHETTAPAPGTYLGSKPAPAADARVGALARRDFSAYEAEETQRDLARARR